MLGLLKKDMRLVMLQKVFFLIVIAMPVLLSSTWENQFAVGYCTMLCAYFTVTTLSYDEMNHGLSFLLTLPVNRRIYVAEKYLLGFLLGVGGWLISMLTTSGCMIAAGTMDFSVEYFPELLTFLAVMCIFLCVMLPLQFKFGAERGRLAIIILFLFIFGTAKIMEEAETFKNLQMGNLLWLEDLPIGVVAAFAVVLLIVLTAVSMRVSIRIMEKKEF